jgi:hypothetical protein
MAIQSSNGDAIRRRYLCNPSPIVPIMVTIGDRYRPQLVPMAPLNGDMTAWIAI